jgi:serine/threonine protein kinase
MLRRKILLRPSPDVPIPPGQETEDDRHEQQQVLKAETKPTNSTEIDKLFKPRDLLFLHLLVSKLDIPVVDLPEKFGVQDAAPRWNRHQTQGAPYLLGSGASCTVVQHETDEDTSEIVPKGTIVALKRYHHDKDADLAADRDLAYTIWQDLRVLRHVHLRNHENFCKILFIAWEEFSVVPAMALELAAFGSLQDALESEFQLSWLQKCHICMDITVGLHSLHQCGFVHGDIKPSNIMLQRHDTRQLVAKILDFSGVTDEERFGTASHRRFLSRLWLPPEVLLGARSLDWSKVDVYAYGMLLTHIWCEIDFENYELYLETNIPKYFTAAQKSDMMLFFKCCPEDDAQSILNQSLNMAKKHSKDAQSKDIMIPLEYIQRGTLIVNPETRLGFNDILLKFNDFAKANSRITQYVQCIPLEGVFRINIRC